MTGPWLEKTRDAVVTPAQGFIGTQNVQRLLVNDKTGDEQIQLAVIVVVEPNCASGPARRSDAGVVGYIGEGAITIVVIKDIAAITLW